ncbi:MAG: DUF1285 domain-containing protein, partial [Sphingomonadales bacterium]
KWNPEFCGDIEMRITRNGEWSYMGSPIARRRLVKLFSSVLRRDEDGCFYLVTPVEKLRIEVDDAPLFAVELLVHGEGKEQVLEFRTKTDDRVLVDSAHPLFVVTDEESGQPSPYVRVRGRLDALISRPVFYELVELAVKEEGGKANQLGVWSSGNFFVLGEV